MDKCTECSKNFIKAPEHLYKTKQGRQCSYTCWNRAKARQESIDMHAKIVKNKEAKMMNFKENEIVICQMGDSFEVGKIKTLRDDGAFVWYHSGDTAAYTPYESMHKIENAAYLTNANLGKDMVTTIKQLAPVLRYCSRLSRVVTPTEAMRHYGIVTPTKAMRHFGIRHDGAVSDFLNDLEIAMHDGNTLNVNDELYGPIYRRMCEDVSHE